MKKSYLFVVLIVVLFLVVLSSCAPADSTQILPSDKSQKNEMQYQTCLSGVTTIPIKVSNKGISAEIIQAYVQIPDEGCNLPILYCSYLKYGYGAGGGCVVIDE